MDYFFFFLSGFGTCAVVLGALWFIRDCEWVKRFKALRQQNEELSAQAAEADGFRRLSELLRADNLKLERRLAELREFAKRVKVSNLGGIAALPAPATPKAERPGGNLQHYSQTFATD